MVLLNTIISFVTCSLHSLYREYWIFRTYNFTCSLISHINVSIEVSFIWHRRFVHCVVFLTMSSLLCFSGLKKIFFQNLWKKKLTSPHEWRTWILNGCGTLPKSSKTSNGQNILKDTGRRLRFFRWPVRFFRIFSIKKRQNKFERTCKKFVWMEIFFITKRVHPVSALARIFAFPVALMNLVDCLGKHALN